MLPNTAAVAELPVLQTMKVLSAKVYRGPHLYSQMPMIQVQLDLGSLEERPTNTLDGFSSKLSELLPGLREHGCSYGEPWLHPADG